jgi:hypothetical protein
MQQGCSDLSGFLAGTACAQAVGENVNQAECKNEGECNHGLPPG